MQQYCEPKQSEKCSQNTDSSKGYSLILFNDDFHTFDYVIDCLITICGHDLDQAQQCTYIVHYKGSCPIAEGTMKELVVLKEKFAERLLNTKITALP